MAGVRFARALAVMLLAMLASCSADHAVDGRCLPTCEDGSVCCGSVCVDRASDPHNCGGCGIECRAGQACTMGECTRGDAGVVDAGDPPAPDGGGACRPACPPSMQCWCGSCVRSTFGVTTGDGRLDPTFANCGACGQACDGLTANRCGTGTTGALECFCGDHPACVAGEACVLGPGGIELVCQDTLSNPSRCGPLGTFCATNESCTAGVCGCGTPDHHCSWPETCFEGSCGCGSSGASCPFGTTCNGLSCVDLLTDPLNCGALSHACREGETCALGLCRCGTGAGCSAGGPPGCGQICCAGVCVESTVEHCGTCANVCADGLACTAGSPASGPCALPGPTTNACPFGAPRPDPLCVGVDCSGLDGTCAVGACAHGLCHAVPRAEGASCGPPTPTCGEQRCRAGACATVAAADCAACAPGMACIGGACGAPPTSLTYDLESGALPSGWWVGGESAAPWTVTGAVAHGGRYAARAGTIADGQQTQLQTTLSLTTPASLSFWSAVDSEAGYDWLRVFVDGVMAAEWSGTSGYVRTTIPLSVGVHVIEWRYVKDANIGRGMDTAWIDDVVVTPTTPGAPLCGP